MNEEVYIIRRKGRIIATFKVGGGTRTPGRLMDYDEFIKEFNSNVNF